MEHTYLKNDPILCTFVIFRRLLMFKKAQKTTRRCIVQSDDAHMFPWVLKKSLSFNPNQTRPSFNPGVEAFDQRLASFAHHITTFYSRSIRRETSRLHPFFFFTPLTWLQWQCEDFLCSSASMPDPTAENKQVLMWEREDRGRTSAVFLNRAAETEPKATPLHPVKREFEQCGTGNTMTVPQLSVVEQIFASHLLCAHFLKTLKETPLLFPRHFRPDASRSPGVSRRNLLRAPVCHLQPSISCLMAISLRKKIALLFEKRDRLWHHYLTILKYPNFTPRTVKRPYHSSQPSAACCWEACAAARSGLIHSSAAVIIFFCTSNLLTLIKNYLHLPSIILSILYCLSSIVSSVRKPSVYCFIDPLWTKGCLLSDLLNSERRVKRVDAPPCCSCTACGLFTHFIAQKLLSSLPAS